MTTGDAGVHTPPYANLLIRVKKNDNISTQSTCER